MARSKNEFIQISKRGKNGTRPDYYADIDRAKRIGEDVFGEYEISDRPVPSSNGATKTMVLPTSGDDDPGSGVASTTERSDRRVHEQPASIDRPLAGYRTTDRSAGNSHTQPDKAQQSRIRKTPLDSVAKYLGRKKPPHKKKEETVLTAQEANKSRLRMIRFFLACTDVIDDSIQVVSKGHRPVSIWSDMEESDAIVLVDACIAVAKRNKKFATTYRYAVLLSYRYDVIKIVLPRMGKTIYSLFTTGIDLRIGLK
jgi:hypothetical protein